MEIINKTSLVYEDGKQSIILNYENDQFMTADIINNFHTLHLSQYEYLSMINLLNKVETERHKEK